ncbi:conjugal transfer protein TraG, partial [Campylobacter sp. MIT 12-5580]
QQLAGSARSASSFSTQQGLSTKTEISTPRGEEVIGVSAGIHYRQGAFEDSQGNLTNTNTKQAFDGAGVHNSDLQNAVFSGTNVGGIMQGASFSSGTMSTANQEAKTLAENWNNTFNDTYSKLSAEGKASMLNVAKGFMEQGNESFQKSFASHFGNEISHNTQLSDSQKANISAYAKAQAGLSAFGSEISAGVEGRATKEWSSSDTLSDTEKAAYDTMMQRASAKTLATSEGIDSSWTQSLRGEDSVNMQKILSHGQSYTEAQSSIQGITSNNADNILNNCARDLAAKDGHNDFMSLDTATQNKYFTDAGNQINGMIKSNPAGLAQFNQQFGAAMTTQGDTFTTRAEGINYANPNASSKAIMEQHNKEMENVRVVGDGKTNSAFLPSEQDVKATASQGNPVADKFREISNSKTNINNQIQKVTGLRPIPENLGI